MKSEFYSHNESVFDLHLIMCGKEQCVPRFKMPPHLREYYLIHYIQQGSVILEENQKQYKAEKGDIFVIYPDILASYYNADGDKPLGFCWIGFVGEAVNYADVALTYIEDNYMKDISSADIVDFVKLNRSYLFKLFKQQTGLSVSQYLIKYRIDKACEFFREYNFTIRQVAQMVGVEDIYYFSKLFKKITGITPSEYKKRQDS